MHRRPNFRPGVERMEERATPSCFGGHHHVYVVTQPLAQQGEGSLAWAVDHVPRGTTIRFTPGTSVALVLSPLTINQRLKIDGGPNGLLLEIDSPISMRHVTFRHVTIVPFENRGLGLD